MKNLGLSAIDEAKEFSKLSAGGYICGITAVEDLENREYLKIEYDIAEGENKNYWRGLYEAKGFWGGSFIKSYKTKALPFFKGFITAVKGSNKGFKWEDDGANDEKTLVRKLVGLVLGEEEYTGNDGSTKTRLYVDSVHTIDKIKSGDFKVPEFKPLPGSTATTTSAANIPADFVEILSDDGVPF